jgi:hypothetical protein
MLLYTTVTPMLLQKGSIAFRISLEMNRVNVDKMYPE